MNARNVLKFLALIVTWTLGVIGLGVIAGAITFPLLGPLFTSAYTPGELAVHGMKKIGFLAMVWAPGVALVMTVKRTYEQRRVATNRLRSENPAGR